MPGRDPVETVLLQALADAQQAQSESKVQLKALQTEVALLREQAATMQARIVDLDGQLAARTLPVEQTDKTEGSD